MNPGSNPVSQMFIDVLLDEEGEDLVVNEDYGELVDEYFDAEDVLDMSVCIVRPDGSLQCVEEEVPEQNKPVYIERPDGSLECMEEVPAGVHIPDLPAPESAPGPAPRFRVEVIDPVAARQRRGTASVRGRGRGRGRGRSGGWMRGAALEHIFLDDTDLPLDIQEQIRDYLTRRERYGRRRIPANVEEENEREEWDENESFVWRGMNEWNGRKCDFVPETTGPTVSIRDPYEALHAIWTDDIMTHIAEKSNRYAESVLAQQRPRFARDWFETNFHEIWTLFAFWIMLGIIRMPSIKSCFTRNPLLKTDIFRTLFLESRYWNLNAAFHLAEGTDPNNPLHPMGPILDHLNAKFQELYQLDRNICIDESLTLWKGSVSFQQYIKTKAARFGIKTYELCESATGYLWSFFVYAGRTTGTGLPSSVSTVLRLIQPLLNLGHTLFMDNWFNSPSLARWLKRRNTDCVGTLRPTRKGVPEAIKRAPLQEGQFIARASDDVMVVALQDRKRVTCISTYHGVSQELVPGRSGHPAEYKLDLIKDYNRAMGGVDRLDSMLEAYLVERKQCLQWNRKLFKRLLNISIQNARVIVEKSTNTKLDAVAFRLALVDSIIKRHLPLVPRPAGPLEQRRPPVFPIERLTERHFIRRIPITDEMRSTEQHRTNIGRRYCVWCQHNKRKRSKTVYECEECGLPLCLLKCFREFHTQ